MNINYRNPYAAAEKAYYDDLERAAENEEYVEREVAERLSRLESVQDLHDYVDVAPYIVRAVAIQNESKFTADNKAALLASLMNSLVEEYELAAKKLIGEGK